MESGRLMPYFSVVVPTYNRADKLKRTIQSVLGQTFGDFELLVMDDGSKDHSREVVESFCDARIRYDWAPNSGGPATPRNRGIHAARAEWICFLDADDIWYPEKLEMVARVIETDPEVDAVCHNEVLSVLAKGKKSLLRHGPFVDDFYRVMLIDGNRVSTSAVAVRREFLKCNSLRFNESRDYVVVEDYDLWLRMAFHGGIFRFIADPLGEYIIEDDNLTGNTSRHRNNLSVLLRSHVYQLQTFEPNKDKLWRQVRVRMDVREAKERITGGHLMSGAGLLIASAIRSPQGFLSFAAAWLGRRSRKR